jgi:DNA-directed RNA polymerase subunit M/transcription elongation factor TFIIS
MIRARLLAARALNFFCMQLNDFYNEGFGWICRHCEPESRSAENAGYARFYHEGEAESKTPNLSNHALARWADPERKTLVCPRCGITEVVNVS